MGEIETNIVQFDEWKKRRQAEREQLREHAHVLADMRRQLAGWPMRRSGMEALKPGSIFLTRYDGARPHLELLSGDAPIAGIGDGSIRLRDDDWVEAEARSFGVDTRTRLDVHVHMDEATRAQAEGYTRRVAARHAFGTLYYLDAQGSVAKVSSLPSALADPRPECLRNASTGSRVVLSPFTAADLALVATAITRLQTQLAALKPGQRTHRLRLR